MESGKDLISGGALYNASGATHIGFADTVDSLNAVEKAVFIDKICTFAELQQALKADFKGHEKLHAWLVNKAPKYGTSDPIAVRNSQALVAYLHQLYQGRENYRGGKYRPGFWSMTNHAGQGKLSGALPNGRMASRVFASGITMTPSIRTGGPIIAIVRSAFRVANMRFPCVSITPFDCPVVPDV